MSVSIIESVYESPIRGKMMTCNRMCPTSRFHHVDESALSVDYDDENFVFTNVAAATN